VLRTLTQHVGRNLELYLMGLSVAIALAIPLAIEVGTNEQELAITALAACVLQGVVFWSLRRRYRRVRLEMIAELRGMLKDRINNHLTIVLMSVTQRWHSPGSVNERELLEAAIAATAAVSRVLEELSMESLRRWKAHYGMDEPGIKTAVFRGERATAAGRTRSYGKTELRDPSLRSG
jgi:hypothetical protein